MVVDQKFRLGILDREIFLALWISMFTLLGLYLLGKIKFKHDSDLKHVGVLRLLLTVITFGFVVYLIPGMFGAPLKSISGLLPSQSTHSFDLLNAVNNRVISTQTTEEKNSLCEEPKYSNLFHLPFNLNGYFEYNQAIACARAEKKPLFIDFTGISCGNCKEMEAKVWSDPKVLERLRRDFIIVALYIDDQTELPENEWVTSTRDGKVKKTIGKKNADFQATRFNMNGQPYYALLDNNEQTLVEPRGYNLDIEEFIKFLDKGVEEFNKRK